MGIKNPSERGNDGKRVFGFEVWMDDTKRFFLVINGEEVGGEAGHRVSAEDVVVYVCDMDLFDQVENAVYTNAE